MRLSPIATDHQRARDISAMQTKADHGRLAWAQAKFDPVARVLTRLSDDIELKHGRSAAFERQGAMEQTAQNAYAVRYSLRHVDEARLSLTFILVGDDADLLLLQRHEQASPPGRVDQRV